MRYAFLLLFCFTCIVTAHSQEIKTINQSQISGHLGKDSAIYKINDSLSYLYTRPTIFEFVGNTATDLVQLPKELFKKENVKGLAVVAVTSAILIHYDEKILVNTQQFCRYIGLSTKSPAKNLSPIKQIPLFVPTGFSSDLYYIGDGITEMAVDGGFYLYGTIKRDERAFRTATELTEGLAIVGIYIQILKHATGRESPFKRTVPGGKWRPLPSFKTYYASVPSHDAFPSGHLATAMMTTTIISMNYPEYKFIKPLCYSLMGICGFQMLNNGVHWMSDYPLAIAMGYAIGRIAVNRGRTKIITDQNQSGLFGTPWFKPTFNIQPMVYGDGGTGLSLSMKF
jgi:hypothetical protein